MNSKIKYIIYSSGAGYVKISLSDVLHNGNIVLFEVNVLLRLSYRLLLLLEKILKIPNSIHKLFFPFFFRKKWINSDEIPVFWFYEHSMMYRDKSFILYLKRRFPNSKTILYLTNAINNKQWTDILKQKLSLYDMIITYNKADAEKYNIVHHQWIYSAIAKDDRIKKEYDLYFVGLDKGRLKLIEQIAEKCESNHIAYNFNVIGYNDEYNGNCSIQMLSNPIAYEDSINNILKSGCVLELVPNDVHACTLRTAEVIACKTKLLTNNIDIVNDEVFNPAQMSVFSSADDINMGFLKKDADIENFNDPDMLSPVQFLQFLEDNLFN
jgi:hypothetical protein